MQNDNQPKRGRGRPRIHPLPDPNAPKRGRGRPRKNDIERTANAIAPVLRRPTYRHSSPVIALVLLTLGSLFLLYNFGFLPWEIWENLWRFWPVFLVLWGVQVILGRSFAAKMITLSTGIVILVFIILASISSYNPGLDNWIRVRAPWWFPERTPLYGAEVDHTKDIRVAQEQFANVTARNLAFHMTTGKFLIREADSSDYIDLTAKYFGSVPEPQINTNLLDGTLFLDVRTSGTKPRVNFSPIKEINYTLHIGNTELPTELQVEVGAGNGDIDLENLKLSKAVLRVGAGTVTMTIPQNGLPPQGVQTELGSGTITMRIPKNVGVQVIYDVGVGRLQVDQLEFSRTGVYSTQDYESNNEKIQVNAKVGAGTLRIERYE